MRSDDFLALAFVRLHDRTEVNCISISLQATLRLIFPFCLFPFG